MSPASQRKRRIVKKITRERLKNIALYYLGRYAATEESLRRVLSRRLAKAKAAHSPSDEDWRQWQCWVNEVVADCKSYHYLDDTRYAQQKVESLRRQGRSATYIRGKLREKGVPGELIETHLPRTDEDDLAAAREFVRRKKLGPHRPSAEAADFYQKDLAKLARAGFSYDISRQALKKTN